MLCFWLLALSTSFSIHEKEVRLSKANNAKPLLNIQKSSFTNSNNYLLHEKCKIDSMSGEIDAANCELEINSTTFVLCSIFFNSTNNDVSGILQSCTFTTSSSTNGPMGPFVTVVGNKLDIIDCYLEDININSPAFVFQDLNKELGIPQLQFSSTDKVVFSQDSSSFFNLTNYPVNLSDCSFTNIIFSSKDSSFINCVGVDSFEIYNLTVSDCNFNDGIFLNITVESEKTHSYSIKNSEFENNTKSQLFSFNLNPSFNPTYVTIEFSDSNFIGCSYKEEKGAIIYLCTESKVTFEGCSFENNTGYVIYSNLVVDESTMIKTPKNISIIDCNFTGTTFEQRRNSSVTLYSEYVTIQGSNFSFNKGIRRGGIVCLYTSLEFNIENCLFTNNTCTNNDGEKSYGGAIYITFGGVDSKITNCNFTGCQTGHFGGAIYTTYLSTEKQRLITIEECNFDSCQTLVERESFGGAITCGKDTSLKEINDGDMILKLCTFTRCKSARGGAIYFFNGHEGSIYDEEKYIVNCTFDSCQILGWVVGYDFHDLGAAIYSQTYILHINQSIFKNMQHGIIYVLMDEGHPPIITDCTFESAENPFNFDLDSHVNITNCHFLNSPIVLNSDIDDIRYGLSFYDCEFKDTSSYFIRLGYDPYSLEFYIFPCSITKCTFSNFQLQSAPTYCIYVGSHVQLTLIDCEFQDLAGKSYQGGLALYIEKKENDSGYAFIQKCKFMNLVDQSASSSGGAIFIQFPFNATIDSCYFEKCQSLTMGGAIFVAYTLNGSRNDILTVSNSQFVNCSSKEKGGAITSAYYTSYGDQGYDGDLNLTGCLFKDCHSGLGGALYFLNGLERDDPNKYINNCTFEDCYSDQEEGAIVYSLAYTISFVSTVFKVTDGNNDRKSIYVKMDESGQSPVFENCTFDHCDGFHVETLDAPLLMNSCIFINASVTDKKFVNINNITFNNCSFRDNNNRNSIEITQNTEGQAVNVIGCKFMNIHNENSVSWGGEHLNYGCFLVSTTNSNSLIMDVIDCVFSEIVIKYAAVVHIDTLFAISNINIEGCNFSKCTSLADSGFSLSHGSLYFKAGLKGLIKRCHFVECTSEVYGGAIITEFTQSGAGLQDNVINITECTFRSCHSKTGGAISCGEAVDGDSHIISCNFTNCTASKSGGAIYFKDSGQSQRTFDVDKSIVNCIFDSCDSDGVGSAISSLAYNTSLVNNTFINNKGNSSFLYLEKDDLDEPVKIIECIFKDNSANIYIKINSGFTANFIRCLFMQSQNIPLLVLEKENFDADEIIFDQCDFNKSMATAVQVLGGRHTFSKCGFHDNSADNISALSITVFDESDKIKVSECTFSNNKAKANGALYIECYADIPSGAPVNVSFCNFLNNQCDKDGGAVSLNLNGYGIETFTNNKFLENQAQNGGAIFAQYHKESAGRPTNISNCIFEKCIATYFGGAFISGTGGLIGQLDEDVLMIECSFKNCKAIKGGAVYCNDGNHDKPFEKSFIYCVFDDNTANEGSCIYSFAYNIELTGSTFTNNKKNDFIVIIMDENPNLKIEYCQFTENYGSIVVMTPGKLDMQHCIFSKSSKNNETMFDASRIKADGGCFYENVTFELSNGYVAVLVSDNSHTFNNCMFLNNTGGKSDLPGGIQLTGTANVILNDCQFIGNIGYYHGGAAHIEITTFAFNNCSFIENICRDPSGGIDQVSKGGAIYFKQVGEAMIENCKFIRNHAKTSGGAIFVEFIDESTAKLLTTQNPVNISNCDFVECTTDSEGGALTSGHGDKEGIAQLDGDMNISFCSFEGCKSQYGGAVYFEDETTLGDEEKYLYNCTFTNNAATKQGGCLYSKSFKLSLERIVFQNNPLSGEGNTFLYIKMDEKEPKIDYCTFINNSATISITLTTGPIIFNNCEFTQYEETAVIQGELLSCVGPTQFISCNVSSCSSPTQRPIKISSNEFMFEGCSFDSNQNGALEFNDQAQASVLHCNFSSNSILDYGGAIKVMIQKSNTSYVHIEYCNFDSNQCLNEDAGRNPSGGGSLYVSYSGANIIINSCNFKNDTSRSTGGSILIWYDRGTGKFDDVISITNSTFIHCNATKAGGAIMCGQYFEGDEEETAENDGDFSITDCIFTECSAERGGGLFFANGKPENEENKFIINCTFDACFSTTAEDDVDRRKGLSIYCRAYTVEIRGCFFKNHVKCDYDLNAKSGSYLYIHTDETEVKPILTNCTFEDNGKPHIEIIAACSELVFDNLIFRNYNGKASEIQWEARVVDLDYFSCNNTRFVNCIFDSIVNYRAIESREVQGKRVSLETCSITNFSFEDASSGCAIRFSGRDDEENQIFVQNCTFMNLVSSGPGAIASDTGSIEISNCTFEDCKSNDEHHFRGGGGAIYLSEQVNNAKPETIKDCIFINCYSAAHGGAIFISSADSETGPDSSHPISIVNCTFEKCVAKDYGGAVACGVNESSGESKYDNDIYIRECNFTECEAERGGAIYTHQGTQLGDEELLISDCIFDNNTAYGKHGLSVYAQSYKLTLNMSIFRNHQGDTDSSFLYIKMLENGSIPIIENCIFDNNGMTDMEIITNSSTTDINGTTYQNYEGDAILINLDEWGDSLFRFNECKFINITGHVINLLAEKKAEINFCQFINITTEKTSERGICIYAAISADICVNYCVFENITNPGYNGGAIHASTNCIELKHSNFTNCSLTSDAGARGGAVYFFQESIYVPKETILNCTFEKCYSKSYGGAIFIQCHDEATRDCLIFINQSIFIECSSGVEGGAITSGLVDWYDKPYGTNDITIGQCQFIRCTSGRGGALYFQDGSESGDEETYIDTCIFDDCYATSGEGFAISCRSYKLQINHCTFKNHLRVNDTNNCSYLYIYMDDYKNPNLDYNIFENNGQADIAIEIIKGDHRPLSINNWTFQHYNVQHPLLNLDEWSTSNDCIFKGFIFVNISNCNCIYLSKVLNVNFESCSFNDIRLEGTQNGGGLSASGSCFFIEMPKDGSEVSGKDWAVIDGCTFKKCYAKNNGGAIYFDTRTTKITHCIFDQCSCGQNSEFCQGGAIFLHEAMIGQYEYEIIDNCNFTKCSASYSGGAIYADALDDSVQNIQIYLCSFTECTSKIEGGAISSGYTLGNTTKDDNDLIIESCNFTRCQSGKGGAVHTQDGTEKGDEDTQLILSTFDDCYATSGQGFALYLQAYSNFISYCTFKNHKGDSMTQSFLYISMDEAPYSEGPRLELNYFINNGMAGIEIHSSGPPSIQNCEFHNYSSKVPVLNIESWSAPDILFLYCIFQNITNSRVISTYSGKKEVKATFEYCEFNNITATDSTGGLTYGGAIYLASTANVTLKDCTFDNISISSGEGGAIYAESNAIEVIDCKFISCKCTDQNGVGGAISLHQTRTAAHENIIGCKFIKCYAGYSGGGFYVTCRDETKPSSKKLHEDMTYQIYLENCNFTECTSGTEGGGVSSGRGYGSSIYGDNDMYLKKCTFIKCQSKRGGGIYFQDGTRVGDENTILEECTFDDCYATNREGYAVSCRSYTLSITNCTFKNHTQGLSTIDSFLYVNMNEDGVTPIIQDCIFENNGPSNIEIHVKANELRLQRLVFRHYNGKYPVLNFNYWESTKSIFTSCSFEDIINNRCVSLSRSFDVTFEHCNFSNISCEDDGSGFSETQGGCFYITGGNVKVSYCQFSNVYSESDGGAIYSYTEAVEVKHSKFNNCSVGGKNGHGGAIYYDQRNKSPYEIIENCSFTNCKSTYSGGALFIKCRDNEKSKLLRSENDHTIRIMSCDFSECSSKIEGGAVSSGITSSSGIIKYGDNDIAFYTCTFTKCQSGKGGALYFQDGTKEGDEETVITACTFDNCYATGREGYAVSCRSYTLSITNCTFKNHIQGSSPSDSFLYVNMNEDGVTPIIQDCIFENNLNSNVHISSRQAVTLCRCKFINNQQQQSGAPLNVDSNWHIPAINLSECEFYNNKGKQGGSLYISQHGQSTIWKCIFNGNSAENGGAIYALKNSDSDSDSDSLTIENCQIHAGSATNYGGAIYTTIPNTVIKSTNITQSTATKGSAIYLGLSGISQIMNVSLLIDKRIGQTAIFISGKEDSATLKITGGCFVSNRDQADNTPDFIDGEFSGKIEFLGKPCFSGTKEQSVKLPSTVVVDDSWFNCHDCDVDPLPSITFTPTSFIPTSSIPTSVTSTSDIPTSSIPTSVTSTSSIPTSVTSTSDIPTSSIPTSVTSTSSIPTSVTSTSSIPTSVTSSSSIPTSVTPTSQTVTVPTSENISYTPSSESSSTDDSDSGSGGKINAGAIAGISIAILIIICCIVIIILIIMFKRKANQTNNPNVAEAPSQEADAETMSFTQNQTMQDENEAIWSGDFGTQDNPMASTNDQDLVDDPFMRDIEEGF